MTRVGHYLVWVILVNVYASIRKNGYSSGSVSHFRLSTGSGNVGSINLKRNTFSGRFNFDFGSDFRVGSLLNNSTFNYRWLHQSQPSQNLSWWFQITKSHNQVIFSTQLNIAERKTSNYVYTKWLDIALWLYADSNLHVSHISACSIIQIGWARYHTIYPNTYVVGFIYDILQTFIFANTTLYS